MPKIERLFLKGVEEKKSEKWKKWKKNFIIGFKFFAQPKLILVKLDSKKKGKAKNRKLSFKYFRPDSKKNCHLNRPINRSWTWIIFTNWVRLDLSEMLWDYPSFYSLFLFQNQPSNVTIASTFKGFCRTDSLMNILKVKFKIVKKRFKEVFFS